MIEVNLTHPPIGFVTLWRIISVNQFGLVLGIYGDSLNAEAGRE